jgi:hypothetical protein
MQVHYCKYEDEVFLNAIDYAIGEMGHQITAKFILKNSPSQRVSLQLPESLRQFLQESFSQP